MKKRTTKLPGAVVKACDKLVAMNEYPYTDLHSYLQLVYGKYCRQANMLWPKGDEEPEDMKWKNNQVAYFYHVANQITFVDTLMRYERVQWELVKTLANQLQRPVQNPETMVHIAECCVFTCRNKVDELSEYPLNDLIMSVRVNSGLNTTQYFWPPPNWKLLNG